MKKYLVGLVLGALFVSSVFAAQQFPNAGNPGRYDMPYNSGLVKQVNAAVPTAARRLRIPQEASTWLSIGSYTSLKIKSVVSTGAFTVTANFRVDKDYGPNMGSWELSTLVVPTNNKAIPIPVDASFVYLDIRNFTVNQSTVNVTINLTMGNNLGSVGSVKEVGPLSVQYLRIGDHNSFTLVNIGSTDAWVGDSKTTTVNSGTLLEPGDSIVVDGSVSYYGAANVSVNINRAETY